MKNTLSKVRGFTLIEMLVVIAIIALLTGIVITSLTGSKAKARDAKRISDIGNLQVALELYFDRCKVYPSAVIGVDPTTISNGLNGSPCVVNLGNFISVIPTAPSVGSPYSYYTSASYDEYVLSATLEGYNEILKDDLDGAPISGMANKACGTANNGDSTNEKIYCVGPK